MRGVTKLPDQDYRHQGLSILARLIARVHYRRFTQHGDCTPRQDRGSDIDFTELHGQRVIGTIPERHMRHHG